MIWLDSSSEKSLTKKNLLIFFLLLSKQIWCLQMEYFLVSNAHQMRLFLFY